MPVLQFQCHDCSAIFESLIRKGIGAALECLACGSDVVFQTKETAFYPNKNFCPHDKKLEGKEEELRKKLSEIMVDESLRCGGCGVDGAAGACASGGCGSGVCGSGGCGSGGGCGSNAAGTTKKISTMPNLAFK